jgi:hypothetical protein
MDDDENKYSDRSNCRQIEGRSGWEGSVTVEEYDAIINVRSSGVVV